MFSQVVFNDPKYSDLTLILDDGEKQIRLYLHRVILAYWSPYFSTMLESQFQERQKIEGREPIRINEVVDIEKATLLFRWLYGFDYNYINFPKDDIITHLAKRFLIVDDLFENDYPFRRQFFNISDISPATYVITQTNKLLPLRKEVEGGQYYVVGNSSVYIDNNNRSKYKFHHDAFRIDLSHKSVGIGTNFDIILLTPQMITQFINLPNDCNNVSSSSDDPNLKLALISLLLEVSSPSHLLDLKDLFSWILILCETVSLNTDAGDQANLDSIFMSPNLTFISESKSIHALLGMPYLKDPRCPLRLECSDISIRIILNPKVSRRFLQILLGNNRCSDEFKAKLLQY